MSLDLEPTTGLLDDELPAEPREEDRKGHELVHGEWVEKGISNLSALVESTIVAAVKVHVRAHKLGFVFGSEGRYQMFPALPKLIRKPDLSFVRLGRLPGDKVPVRRMELAPDLAVEVMSPTDLADEVETKLDEYIRAGVRLSWFVYVPTQVVWAYRPDGTARRYTTADLLPGEDVLPGFAVPVAELFEGI